MAKLVLENQFGEVSDNYILDGSETAEATQAFSNALPAKAGVTAIAAIPTPITAITIALSTANTYTDAAVNAAVNAALVTVVADLTTQLSKINAILAAMKVVS